MKPISMQGRYRTRGGSYVLALMAELGILISELEVAVNGQ